MVDSRVKDLLGFAISLMLTDRRMTIKIEDSLVEQINNLMSSRGEYMDFLKKLSKGYADQAASGNTNKVDAINSHFFIEGVIRRANSQFTQKLRRYDEPAQHERESVVCD